MLDPTCGFSTPQKVLKITALIDLGLSVACSVLLSFAFFFFLHLKIESGWSLDSFTLISTSTVSEGETLSVTNLDMVLIGYSLISSVIYIFLSVVLYKAVQQRSAVGCKIWLFLTVVITLVYYLFVLVAFDNLKTTQDFGLVEIGFIVYTVYEIWVLMAFLAEIKKSRGDSPVPNDFESIPFT